MKCQPVRQKCEQNLFCALFRLSNDNRLSNEKVMFRWFCIPQVVQKQVMGEVGN